MKKLKIPSVPAKGPKPPYIPGPAKGVKLSPASAAKIRLKVLGK